MVSPSAQKILPMCCTGAHLLPNTGTVHRLPTAAVTHKIPATNNLWMFTFFIFSPFGFDKCNKKRRHLIRYLRKYVLQLPTAALSASGLWVEGLPSSQPACASSPCFIKFFMNIKIGDTHTASPKESNYDFLRRHYPHQVKGSKLITSSQPANTSSPVYFYYYNTQQ